VNPKLEGAGLGALIGGAVIWALETYLFKGTLPGVLRDFIDWLVPVILALISGWLTPPARTPTGTGGGRNGT
jgi:hypothetical protein